MAAPAPQNARTTAKHTQRKRRMAADRATVPVAPCRAAAALPWRDLCSSRRLVMRLMASTPGHRFAPGSVSTSRAPTGPPGRGACEEP